MRWHAGQRSNSHPLHAPGLPTRLLARRSAASTGSTRHWVSSVDAAATTSAYWRPGTRDADSAADEPLAVADVSGTGAIVVASTSVAVTPTVMLTLGGVTVRH